MNTIELIEALREHGKGQEMFGFDGMLDDGYPLLIEAANEIERLQDELALCCELKREYQERAASAMEAKK
jgi:hypothetical protein